MNTENLGDFNKYGQQIELPVIMLIPELLPVMFIFLLLLKVWQQSFITVNKDRFRRAYFGIMLNIAEGSSRFSNKDRKNFMVNARGSAFDILTSAATKQ